MHRVANVHVQFPSLQYMPFCLICSTHIFHVHVHGCTLQVWSVLDGTQLDEYIFHSDHVNCVLYSPTQPHILSAADNGIIKVSSFRLNLK